MNEPLGITIQDGPFPSFIPYGFSTNQFLFAHVEESQLIRDISTGSTPLLSRVLNVVSNWKGTRDAGREFLPILDRSEYLRSIFVDRVVDSTMSHSDARVSEITDYGNGCLSVFAAKIITCETTGRAVAASITGVAA